MQRAGLNFLVIGALFFCVGAAGREIAREEAPVSRDLSAASMVTSQTMGVARAIPLISLWSRAKQAHNTGAYEEEKGLLEMIESLSPNSVMVSYHRAQLFAGSIASRQSSAEDEWRWIDEAFDVVDEAIQRHPRSAKPWETACWLMQSAAPRFPFRSGKRAAQLLRDHPASDQERARALQLTLDASNNAMEQAVSKDPALRGFMRSVVQTGNYADVDGYEYLSADQRAITSAASELRAKSMYLLCLRGFEEPRHRDWDLVTFALFGLRYTFDAQAGNDEIRADLRSEAFTMIQAEIERLEARGDLSRTNEFLRYIQQKHAQPGEWLYIAEK